MHTCAIRSAWIGTLGVALALASGSALATTYRLTELTLEEGTYSTGEAINALGQVTGYAWDLVGVGHNLSVRVCALFWDGTTLHDLNSLIDPADPLQPFVTLIEGVDINDRGQVVANGRDSRNAGLHAYVVSPVPAPAPPPPTPPTVESSGGGGAFDVIVALALLCLGLAGLGLSKRRKAH